MVMVLVGARPWLTKDGSQPATRGDNKTPSQRGVDPPESRVSSGSTLKTMKPKAKMGRTYRQLSRRGLNYSLLNFLLLTLFLCLGGKGDNPAAVDRAKWKTMQNFMNDTVRFVEMIHS